MNPNEKVLVNYRIPLGLKEKFDIAARKHGKSATGFVQQIMEFVVFISPEFLEKLMELAQVHQDICERCRFEERRRNVE